MRKVSHFLLFLCLTSGISLVIDAAQAHENKLLKQTLTVKNAWARATFASAKTGAVYMIVNNKSKQDVTLMSVRVDSSVADDSQLHETLLHNDMMQMREAMKGFEINSGEVLEFQPGGKHIMLLGLTKPLLVGEQFMISLIFENNKILRVPVVVKDAR